MLTKRHSSQSSTLKLRSAIILLARIDRILYIRLDVRNWCSKAERVRRLLNHIPVHPWLLDPNGSRRRTNERSVRKRGQLMVLSYKLGSVTRFPGITVVSLAGSNHRPWNSRSQFVPCQATTYSVTMSSGRSKTLKKD